MNTSSSRHVAFSPTFLFLAMLFAACLLLANFLTPKIMRIGPVALPAAVLVFPISYIVSDCVTEVWGWRRARFLIWTAFCLNFFAVVVVQAAVWMPSPDFWHGGEAFNAVFDMVPRVTLASFLAFLSGSFLNARVMSSMKKASRGKHFSLRAIASTAAGEGVDSLIFFPLAFWGQIIPGDMVVMMAVQAGSKTLYEVCVLPLTIRLVAALKRHEGCDVYDEDVSYSIWKVTDMA